MVFMQKNATLRQAYIIIARILTLYMLYDTDKLVTPDIKVTQCMYTIHTLV